MSRLRELRKRRGLSADELAAIVNTDRSKIYKLERGEQRLTDDWLRRLAQALGVAPSDVLGGNALTVPILYRIAAAFGEGAEGLELSEPVERIHPPRRLDAPEDCFAAEVADDSCDALYPPGSILIARRTEALERPLAIGDKVIVRHFATERAAGDAIEILAGVLDRSIEGDLLLLHRSRNRRLAGSTTIRRAAVPRRLGERPAALYDLKIQIEIPYAPADDDQAEILGRIVMAITPE